MVRSRKKRPPKNKRQKKKTKIRKRMVGGLKVNCNVANEKHVEGSCLSVEVIEKLREEYNKDHPNSHITETDPKKILRIIMESVHCSDDERCALKIIDEVALQKKYLKMLYAPNHPESWIKNPDEWLTNEDIDKVLEDFEKKYGDFQALVTTPIDFDARVWGQCVEREFCNFSLESEYKKGKKRFGAVFNLDKHDQPGSHWISLFVSIPDAAIVFFDSALGGVPKEIDAFTKRIQKQAKAINIDLKFYTNVTEHQKGDTECGMYSIYFITEMLDDFKNLEKFLKGRIDDKTVFKLRDVYYNDPLK